MRSRLPKGAARERTRMRHATGGRSIVMVRQTPGMQPSRYPGELKEVWHEHMEWRDRRRWSWTMSQTPAPLSKRTIRRHQLREIVPLADTTIYDMEQRGEFPQRFYLTSRTVVWDLNEVEAWLEERRRAPTFRACPSAPVCPYAAPGSQEEPADVYAIASEYRTAFRKGFQYQHLSFSIASANKEIEHGEDRTSADSKNNSTSPTARDGADG